MCSFRGRLVIRGVRRPVNIRVCVAYEHSAPPTCSEKGRQLEPELAFWSEFTSAFAAQVHFLCLCDYFVLLFFVFGRVLVLTRLDKADLGPTGQMPFFSEHPRGGIGFSN